MKDQQYTVVRPQLTQAKRFVMNKKIMDWVNVYALISRDMANLVPVNADVQGDTLVFPENVNVLLIDHIVMQPVSVVPACSTMVKRERGLVWQNIQDVIKMVRGPVGIVLQDIIGVQLHLPVRLIVRQLCLVTVKRVMKSVDVQTVIHAMRER